MNAAAAEAHSFSCSSAVNRLESVAATPFVSPAVAAATTTSRYVSSLRRQPPRYERTNVRLPPDSLTDRLPNQGAQLTPLSANLRWLRFLFVTFAVIVDWRAAGWCRPAHAVPVVESARGQWRERYEPSMWRLGCLHP